MNSQTHEKVSALMDGELARAEMESVFTTLERDPHVRGVWGRYQLISDALRGEPVGADVWKLADQVRDRLAEEPPILAPRWKRVPHGRWVRAATGVAMAASVATAAILLGPRLLGPASVPLNGLAGDPVRGADLVAATGGMHWNVSRPEVEEKLNAYLLDHRKQAPATYRRGVVPYATFVGYDSQR